MKREEFEQEFIAYSDELLKEAFYRLHNKQRAEDVVGKLFLNIWERWDGSLHRESIRGYMKNALKNLITNELNSHVNEQTLESDEVLYSLLDPEQEYIWKEFQEKLPGILAQVKPIDLEAFWMRYIDQLKTKEIAEILDVSESTVKRRVQRAFKKLKELVQKEFFLIAAFLVANMVFLIQLCKETLFK